MLFACCLVLSMISLPVFCTYRVVLISYFGPSSRFRVSRMIHLVGSVCGLLVSGRALAGVIVIWEACLLVFSVLLRIDLPCSVFGSSLQGDVSRAGLSLWLALFVIVLFTLLASYLSLPFGLLFLCVSAMLPHFFCYVCLTWVFRLPVLVFCRWVVCLLLSSYPYMVCSPFHIFSWWCAFCSF